jgi:hypothetical protein
MATYDRSKSEPTRRPMTKAEFFQAAGITPDLEKFISDFVGRPEILDTLSPEQQQEIEAQMDAVLASLC